MWGLDAWCESGVLVLVVEQGVTFSIGHSTLSLSLCCREIGTFLDLKRYRSGIYWGIYSRGGVTALHWRRRGYMGGGGTLRRVHVQSIQRSSDRNIQRPCIQWTFVLTSSLRQCYKSPAISFFHEMYVLTKESLCMSLSIGHRPPTHNNLLTTGRP